MRASTLRGGYAKRLVEKPDVSSSQRMIPAPTRVGGGARLQSAQGVSRASFRARRDGSRCCARRDRRPPEKSSPANLTSAGLDESRVVEQALRHRDARPGPPAVPSAGRGTRGQRLSGGHGEAVADLPIPGDVESEQGDVSTDYRSGDRGDEREEP